jgi:hypothetical protein
VLGGVGDLGLKPKADGFRRSATGLHALTAGEA